MCTCSTQVPMHPLEQGVLWDELCGVSTGNGGRQLVSSHLPHIRG